MTDRYDGMAAEICRMLDAVANEYCSCGGGGPRDEHSCDVCRFYHEAVSRIEDYAVSETVPRLVKAMEHIKSVIGSGACKAIKCEVRERKAKNG